MLLNGVNRFLWSLSNYTAPSATPGTSVTPGASNAEGSWTQLFTGAQVVTDVYDLFIAISGGNTSAAAKNHLLDIGIDTSGGSSYAQVVQNILCSQSQATVVGACQFRFPIFIPAGSSIAVRVRGSNATAGTVRVVAKLFGRPTHPEYIFCGNKVKTLGAVEASSLGTSFTPGNATYGSWASLGQLTDMAGKFVQLGMGVNNGTITAQYTFVDLGISSNNTTFSSLGMERTLGFYNTAEIASWFLDEPLFRGFVEIPRNWYLGVRGYCNTTPATGYNALAHVVG